MPKISELNFWTQEEIADKTDISQSRIAEIIGKFSSELSNNPLVPEQQKQIIGLYLQCLNEREIEAKLGVSDSTIHRMLQDFKNELLKQPPVPESLQLFNVYMCCLKIFSLLHSPMTSAQRQFCPTWF